MGYTENLLTPGEVIVVRARQHWLALLLDARLAIGLWIVAAVLIGAILVFDVGGTARDVLSWIWIAALLIGAVVFGYYLWRWRSQDYLVTNRRILKVEGILNKRAADSSLEKINDAVLEQNIVGRLMNYGDLDILTAADAAIDQYRMLRDATNFKREMLTQKHALEMGFAAAQRPTPPLRVDDDGDHDPDDRPTVDGPADGAGLRSEPVVARGVAVASAARPTEMAPSTASSVEPEPVSAGQPIIEARSDDEVIGSPMVAPARTVDEVGFDPRVPAAAPLAPSPLTAPLPDDASIDRALGGPDPAASEPVDETISAPVGPAPQSDSEVRMDAPSGVGADAREVTQTLSRLADLRDRGAITDDEFEAKKRELLDRL